MFYMIEEMKYIRQAAFTFKVQKSNFNIFTVLIYFAIL